MAPTVTEVFQYAAEEVDIGARDLPSMKARFLLASVIPGDSVLDVGCGGGKMLRTVGANRSAVRLFGCDVKEPAGLHGEFEFTLVDPVANVLPYRDGSMDVVVLIDVLEHVDRPDRILDEVARVLRPAGRLAAFVPVEGERLSWYRLFRSVFGEDLYERTKGHVQAFTHVGLDRLLSERFVVEAKAYAYHPIGQFLDATLCAAMQATSVRNAFWAHSPYHGSSAPNPTFFARAFARLLRTGNFLAWLESRLFHRVRFGAAGVLIAAHPHQGADRCAK
jgi:SAM-dependent methyltransferase